MKKGPGIYVTLKKKWASEPGGRAAECLRLTPPGFLRPTNCCLPSMLNQPYLWLLGNGGMGYKYNYYYYHSSIPYQPKVTN